MRLHFSVFLPLACLPGYGGVLCSGEGGGQGPHQVQHHTAGKDKDGRNTGDTFSNEFEGKI